MRIVSGILFIFFFFPVYSQDLVYLQTGRPLPLERNNAFRTVGKLWGISFSYEGGDVYDESVHGSIETYNSSILQRVQEKYPDVTFERILEEVELEVNRQEELALLVKSSVSYKTWKHKEMSSTLFLFDRDLRKHLYTIYRIYAVNNENGQHFEVGQVYKANSERKKIRLLKLKTNQLPFRFPENGIQ